MVLGKLVCFLAGIYGGIYIDQQYKMPKVDDPGEVWQKLKETLEQYKKENPGPSKSD